LGYAGRHLGAFTPGVLGDPDGQRHLIREGLLDVTLSEALDYYLVMTGPAKPGATRAAESDPAA
jgi:hypothetical protein